MTAPADPRPACVVIGGAGQVGRMFVDVLLGLDARVCVVDPAGRPVWLPEGCAFERGDVTAPGPGLAAVLARADVVVLAVPEQVALDAVGSLAALIRPDALLVDTLSVKTRIVRAVADAFPGAEALSLNPMFAPALGMADRPIAAVAIRDGPRSQELLAGISRQGACIIRLTADQHDRISAAVQALTHAAVLAFGHALAGLGVGSAEMGAMAPPPHRLLLALLARIDGGSPHTYWDVQAANPYAARARESLVQSTAMLATIVDTGRQDRFAEVLGDIRDLLGHDAEHYRQLCAEAFRHSA
jgi:prephenate dehydrogenase